jgi:predicted hotdog family 3-hydroxylacyl-ACP dehydratase
MSLNSRTHAKIEAKLCTNLLDFRKIFIIKPGQRNDRLKYATTRIVMPVENIRIEDLIPHRDGMKLVDDILEVNEEMARTSSVVTEAWPVDEADLLNPVILVELVAQTSGVQEGWKANRKGKGGTKGWLVGIKKAAFFTDAIPLGTVLTTTVRTLYALQTYAVFAGTVEAASKVLAEVEVQVFREEDDERRP